MMPDTLSLTHNREETLDVFRAIRRATRKFRALKLDFTTLHRVTPAAALVLAAELDRWRRIHKIRPVVFDADRWDPNVSRLLFDMGLFDLVEAQNLPVIRRDLEPVERFIRYRTGRGALGEEAVALREAVESCIGEGLPSRRAMYRGVTEAMTNVHKHAYIGPFVDATPIIKDAWWIGGGFAPDQHRLRVLVYDQGIGIPATLPRRYALERVTDVLRGRGWHDNDAGRIAAAMELGRTRTGNPNQGRGLPDLQLFVNAADRATLRILSRRGEYIYVEGAQPQLVEHSRPLGGTLIQWEINL